MRAITYWVTTAVFVVECLVGGVMGALRLPPFLGTATHLGYPDYFMAILGLVLLAAGLPRLKEWAYAGLISTTPEQRYPMPGLGMIPKHLSAR